MKKSVLIYYILPGLAILGVMHACRVSRLGSQSLPEVTPYAQPAKPPYEKYVAGVGIVEASSENIKIGTQIAGVVDKVFVKPGDLVKAGDVLFVLDSRKASADYSVQLARVSVAKAELNQAKEQLRLWESVPDRRAVSEDSMISKRSAVSITEAKLKEAEATTQLAQTHLDLHSVKAPIEGRILQIKTRVGEFAVAGITEPALVLLGNVDKLNVRVDIDENDAWRVKSQAKAKGFVRGNSELTLPLEFVRFEPYVLPKRSLTGESSERVDTRVLQVIFQFTPPAFPVYVGQLLDIFIEE